MPSEETVSPGRRPPPDEGEPIGSYLRTIRNRRGLTLRDVAERTENAVGQSYVSQVESGRIASPTPLALRRLAEVYELDPLDVLRRAHYLPPEDPAEEARAPLPAGLNWLPASDLRSLNEEERDELHQYLDLILRRRERRAATEQAQG